MNDQAGIKDEFPRADLLYCVCVHVCVCVCVCVYGFFLSFLLSLSLCLPSSNKTYIIYLSHREVISEHQQA